MIEPVITLGNLVTIVAFIVTVFANYKLGIERHARIEYKVNLMWAAFKKRFDITENGE